MATKRKWHKTPFPGVRYREHPTRKHGVQKDKYFAIYYRLNGSRKEEGLGWATQQWTAQKASIELSKLKENQTLGEGPQTLEEKRKIAEEKARIELENQIQAEKDAITFSDLFNDRYFPEAKINKSPRSWKREKQLFEIWINPVIGDLSLKVIKPSDIENIKKNMMNKGRAPRSVEYCLAVIRQVFNFASRDGIFDGPNPTKHIKRPKKDNRRLRFLTHDEADQLLKKLMATSQDVHDIALLSLHSGLRAGEIFSLKWDDLDIERGLIAVIDPKPKKNRMAFMTQKVKKMFKDRETTATVDLIFPARKGKKMESISNTFNRCVDKLGFNAGVDDDRQRVVFHTLRHTFASWLVEKGEGLYTVKELLGHSTLAMTERYAHLGNNTLQNAVNKLESISDQ